MRTWWIKFGCFLTGYNYDIVRASSEVSAKAVKKYTSALLIVCILWFFIGFMFTRRYVYDSLTGSFAGAVIMVVIIIQIERQIILAVGRNKKLYAARAFIAMLMAIIGSIVIDQIVFKEDIELEKITYIQDRVDQVLPSRSALLVSQIAGLDSAIKKRDSERLSTIAEVAKTPLIRQVESHVEPQKVASTTYDSAGKPITAEKIVYTTSARTSNIANPKLQLIAPLEQTISDLRKQKSAKDSALLNIRPQLENEIKSKNGFLDELNVMIRLITRSRAALFVWIMWFLLLMGLEMLVLISKLGENKNDYDQTIIHQMDLQMKKLEALARSARSGQ